jgi:hypothetical protein
MLLECQNGTYRFLYSHTITISLHLAQWKNLNIQVMRDRPIEKGFQAKKWKIDSTINWSTQQTMEIVGNKKNRCAPGLSLSWDSHEGLETKENACGDFPSTRVPSSHFSSK